MTYCHVGTGSIEHEIKQQKTTQPLSVNFGSHSNHKFTTRTFSSEDRRTDYLLFKTVMNVI